MIIFAESALDWMQGAGVGGPIFILAIVLSVGGVLFWLFGAPLLARKLGTSIGGLYDPKGEHVRIVPEYSIAEARRKAGKYVEAIAEYRKGLAEYPDDALGHVRIAEIFLDHLHEPRQAEAELLAALSRPTGTLLVAHRLADL